MPENAVISPFRLAAGLRPAPSVALALAAVLLGGCQTTVQVQSRFDAAAAEAALKPGDNTIKGSAFMRKKSGTVVTAAGEVVHLVPATAYAVERFEKLFPRGKFNPALGARRVETTDTDYERLTRQTKVDKNGNFSFENVRPGIWYVSTRVSWTEPRETLPSGGAIYDRVEVKGSGQEVEVILSGN